MKESKKKCSKCKEIKSLDKFGKKTFNKDGLNHYCKICENNRSKLKYLKPDQKEKRKYYNILRLYNLTKDEYFLKLDNQNHKCSICLRVLINKKETHVDHCHTTGKVRDILCSNCNHILGAVKEDIEYLNKIIDYLKKYYPQK